MKTVIGFLFLASSLFALAQSQHSDQPASLGERACAGDASAQSDLEQNADSQDLRRMMHDPNCRDKVGARFILAKRGDPEALQFFACRSLSDKLEVVGGLLADLGQIGGGFTVAVYRRLLDSDARFQEDLARAQENASDYFVMPPSDSIPARLHELLPNASVPALTPLQRQAQSSELERVKSLWRSWIDSHQAELMQMKPTPQAVSFDLNACSAVPDLTTLQRRLRVLAGDSAVACGHSRNYSSEIEETNKCVMKAFHARKAFYASYSLGGDVVWNVAAAIAGDRNGRVFVVSFDDAGANREGLGSNFEVFDNNATVAAPCPKPIRFKKAYVGNLTCLTEPGNLDLSPR